LRKNRKDSCGQPCRRYWKYSLTARTSQRPEPDSLTSARTWNGPTGKGKNHCTS